MNINTKSTLLTFSLMLISAFAGWKGHSLFDKGIDSQIISRSEAEHLTEDWGKLIVYTPEEGTETFGTKNTLTAVAEIKPGQQIHPPHQHTAEEFIYILEGNGTWSMKGEETDLKAGDVMYAAPWDWHGLTNTGDTTLKFFVVKWDNKGVETPTKR
ncbi:cupin domain-containing protein [Roseivirga sp.]|uniref:cupin domain-containing protein n=1 Tax=Roseivirga sp. TaxID=1964215 RepID=UPI003B52108F